MPIPRVLLVSVLIFAIVQTVIASSYQLSIAQSRITDTLSYQSGNLPLERPSAQCTNYIQNSGFELDTNWKFNPFSNANYSTLFALEGERSGFLSTSAMGTGSRTQLWQDLTVPGNVGTYDFDFYLRAIAMDSQEPLYLSIYDTDTLEILFSEAVTGAVIDQWHRFSLINQDASILAGRNIQIELEITANNNGVISDYNFDNFQMIFCDAPTPTPTPTPTLDVGCTNHIQNSGFELDENWKFNPFSNANYSTLFALGGERSSFLSTTTLGTGRTTQFWQDLSVPTNVGTYDIDFYLRAIAIDPVEPLYLLIFDTDTNEALFSEVVSGAIIDQWSHIRLPNLDASNLAGRNIQIQLEITTTNNGVISNYNFDNFRMIFCDAPTPTSTPIPIPIPTETPTALPTSTPTVSPTPTTNTSTPTPTTGLTPSPTPTFTVTPSIEIDGSGSGAPGSTFIAHGNGFTPNADVVIFLNGEALVTIPISESGEFWLALITISDTVPGEYIITTGGAGEATFMVEASGVVQENSPPQGQSASEIQVPADTVNRILLPYLSNAPAPTIVPDPAWQPVGGGPLVVDSLALNSNTLFATDRRAPDNGGGLYQRTVQGCEVPESFNQDAAIDVGVSGMEFEGANGLIAAFTNGLFYSQNGGTTWATAQGIQGEVYSVQFATQTGYAGVDTSLYESINAGATWQFKKNVIQPINVIRRLGSSLWLGTDGGGIKELTLGNNALIDQVLGLETATSRQVWDIYINSDTNQYYIATYDGVFSGSGFNTWRRVGENLIGVETRALEMSGDRLYIATRQKGVYQISISNPTTWTQVTNGHAASATWTVRDLLYDDVYCRGLLAATDEGVWLLR